MGSFGNDHTETVKTIFTSGLETCDTSVGLVFAGASSISSKGGGRDTLVSSELDGVDTCSNPDHNFVDPLSGRGLEHKL